eukprot:Colp12_sorted_trinity150504_noHs@32739
MGCGTSTIVCLVQASVSSNLVVAQMVKRTPKEYPLPVQRHERSNRPKPFETAYLSERPRHSRLGYYEVPVESRWPQEVLQQIRRAKQFQLHPITPVASRIVTFCAHAVVITCDLCLEFEKIATCFRCDTVTHSTSDKEDGVSSTQSASCASFVDTVSIADSAVDRNSLTRASSGRVRTSLSPQISLSRRTSSAHVSLPSIGKKTSNHGSLASVASMGTPRITQLVEVMSPSSTESHNSVDSGFQSANGSLDVFKERKKVADVSLGTLPPISPILCKRQSLVRNTVTLPKLELKPVTVAAV